MSPGERDWGFPHKSCSARGHENNPELKRYLPWAGTLLAKVRDGRICYLDPFSAPHSRPV
jgi:hypothetical protein